MADPLTTIAQIVGITTAALTVATTLATRTYPWLRTKITSRAVTQRLSTILTRSQVERAVRYYVEPMCQDIDPAGAEEPRLVFAVRQKLFRALDEALSHPTEFRYVFLLADSGMGKSSALINYYARHLRRLRKEFDIEVIPLGIPDADYRIAAITEKASKVLFLDAFDEDTLAIVDHAERLRSLLRATKDFRRVLITCRTQFFAKDEEIPIRTGVIKVGVRGADEAAEYYFHKIYISPFSDREVGRYIRGRYPVWHRELRRRAFRMAACIPNLSVRPMLLAHIDDLVKEGREVRSSVELYEEMVEAWLRREEGFVRSKDDLRRFSEFLAVDIYTSRAQRGAERVTSQEIDELAKRWSIPIESWVLTGRSLLNRDAQGNFKFAHRSIMEYLFVTALFQGNRRCTSVPWTDQMRAFFVDVAPNRLWRMRMQGKSGTTPVETLFECFDAEDLFRSLCNIFDGLAIGAIGVVDIVTGTAIARTGFGVNARVTRFEHTNGFRDMPHVFSVNITSKYVIRGTKYIAFFASEYKFMPLINGLETVFGEVSRQ